MTFRARLVTGFLAVALLPLAVLAVGVRREMHTRVITQNERRADTLSAVVANDFAEVNESVGTALSRIANALPDDSRFRAGALRPEAADRGYVLDYAATAMRAAGLSALQIRNDSGRILSSGHFPGEFDRMDDGLPAALGRQTVPTLVTMRTAAGVVMVLARVDSVNIGGRTFTLIGGRTIDQAMVDGLAGGEEIRVRVTTPDTAIISLATIAETSPSSAIAAAGGSPPLSAPGNLLRRVGLAYLDATASPIEEGSAELAIGRWSDDDAALRRSIDRWIIAAFLLATAAAVLTALWLAARLSRPMEDLAAATTAVDLDRVDVGFATTRTDEIGVLSRRLTTMVERLRSSAARLREAERRATVGEIARQVNHDIKNGLAPIRNVVRHLAQVATEQPGELPAIFTARRGTLESSIGYLETLAENYARLSPSLAARPTDVASVVAEVVGTPARGGAIVRARTAPGLPPVLADAVVLRRILENLVGNAVDSLDGKPGEVTVIAELAGPAARAARGSAMVRLTVEDTGRGMTESELARAFDDFHTTKPHGTGLGLSVVRRLVADLAGALRIETEPGVGTRVQVDLPAANVAAGAAGSAPVATR